MPSKSSLALALICALAMLAGPTRAETYMAVIPAAMSNPTGPLSLEAALDLALTANPELSAATNELRAVEGAVIQAGLRPNPDISTSVEDTEPRDSQHDRPARPKARAGGKRAARVAIAERGREVADADLAARRLEVRAAVVGAFFDVLVAQERLQQTDDLVALAQRATLAAARRVAAGKVSPVEETKARVAEAAARIELNQARADLVTTRKRLAATWGSTQPRFTQAEGRTEALPTLLSDDALASRLETAPALRRWRHEVERLKAQAELEKAKRIPDMTVSVGAKRAEDLGRNQAIVGLSIPFPVFDRNQGNLLEALRRADKARDELRAAELRLGADATQNQERLKALLADVQTLQQEILPGARSAYDAATKGFELGKFSFLEVLDAQRTFFQARAQYLKSLSDAHRTASELERVLGAITSPSSMMADRP
jgi:cobalt-zinc-cadmium efflux system outer membrane protein